MSTILHPNAIRPTAYRTDPFYEMGHIYDYAVCVYPPYSTHLIPVSAPFLASTITMKRSNTPKRYSPYPRKSPSLDTTRSTRSIHESFAHSPILFDCLATGKTAEKVQLKSRTPSPHVEKAERSPLPRSKVTDILLKTVNFVKNSHVVKNLSEDDKTSLLDSCWLEIFLLYVVQEIQLTDDVIMTSVGDVPNSFDIMTTWKLLQRCQNLKLSSYEFDLLRDLLFLDRVNNTKTASQIDEDIFKALTHNPHNDIDYQSRIKYDQMRLSQIFLNVYSLRGIKTETVENIFLFPTFKTTQELNDELLRLMKKDSRISGDE